MNRPSRVRWLLVLVPAAVLAAFAASAFKPSPTLAEMPGTAPAILPWASYGGFMKAEPSAATVAAAPSIGTTDTVDATAHVPRASGTPCIVELFRDVELYEPGRAYFSDESDTFAYAPPVGCAGPWAKVILKVAVGNDAPSAYQDGLTLAQLAVGGVPLYAGGGQFNSGPTHWRVERDVTDYSAVLKAAGRGFLELRARPRYSEVFRSRYRVSATLLFYPANPQNRAQRVPDQVISLSPRGFGELLSPTTPLAATLAFPRNVERAYLDVIAQPRYGNDLHWFTCLPEALLTEFPELTHPYAIGPERLGLEGAPVPQGCTGGSFREVMVSIDGQPAGLAPILPKLHPQFSASWTSTPLYQPVPAPFALNYLPYRVDLTPFAGLLSDGATHSVSLSMNTSDNLADFDVSGTVLIYRDAQTPQVTGQITRNTMASMPAPTRSDTLHRTSAGEVQGLVITGSLHQYELEGYIDTARGRIRTQVTRSLAFRDKQSFYARDPAGTENDAYLQLVELDSRSTAITRQWRDGTLIVDDADYLVLPLTLVYEYGGVDMSQTVSLRRERWRPGVARYYARLRHDVNHNYHQPGTPAAPYWQATQHFLFRDSYGSCHAVDLHANQGALVSYQTGTGCPEARNRLFWASHPDGSPDELGWVRW